MIPSSESCAVCDAYREQRVDMFCPAHRKQFVSPFDEVENKLCKLESAVQELITAVEDFKDAWSFVNLGKGSKVL